MGFGNLAKMAQQMQAEMARVQAELEVLTIDGSAGGGAVQSPRGRALVSVTGCFGPPPRRTARGR